MDVFGVSGKRKARLPTAENLRSGDWKKSFSLWKNGNSGGKKRDDLLDWFFALGCTAAIAFVFYRSVFGMLTGIFLIPFFLRFRRKERRKKKDEELLVEFRSAMQSVSGALLAGYALEGAWVEAEKELRTLYGSDAELVKAFSAMNHHVRMNEPLEKLFVSYAYHTEIEDICNFAEIFQYAKKSGGNMAEIIRTTIQKMRDRAEIEEDIKTAVTAKKLEQRMMMLLMPGMLLFITMSSPEYAGVLYQTPLGIVIMTACLAGYLFSSWWSAKIMNIQV